MSKMDEKINLANSPQLGRIEKMVQEMCPDGVKWVKVGEVCDFLTGFAFKASLFVKKGEPICKTTNIQNGLVDFTDMVCICLNDYDNLEKYIIHPQDIVIGMSGSIKVGINNSNKCCFLNQRVGKFLPNEEVLFNKYLYFLLLNKVTELSEGISGGSVKNLSNEDVKDLSIPLPPLPIQEAIADILDKFDRLSAELQAELQARKQQYEYYRDQLLAPSNSPRRGESEWKEYTLGELGTFTYGFTAKAKESGAIRYIRITDINENGRLFSDDARYIDNSEEVSPYLLNKGDLVMARTGATYGKTLYYEDNYSSAYASFLIKIHFNQQILDHRYYWHFSKSNQYWEQARKLVGGGAQPQFNTGAISQIKILVPPLSEQARIVAILDKFEALVNDLSQGLPAEIAAVKEQYEYYRNKLLTFS